MSKLEISLKSGVQILTDATEVTIQRNAFHNVIGVKWVTPADAERELMYLAIEDISAIVFIEDNSDGQP